MLMASVTWEKILRQHYGDQMQDVLAGTVFAPLAQKHEFGLYVIRGAYEASEALSAHRDLQTLFRGLELSEAMGVKSISVGSKATEHYKTVQAVTGCCRCQHRYPGTEKHLLYNVDKIPALQKPTQWITNLGRGSGVTEFNQFVANEYSCDADDAIPLHTDDNDLLEKCTEILTLSMGAPGIFCFEPDTKLHNASPLYEAGWNTEKKASMTEKRQQF